ncbi:N-acetylmuramidase domain-containing protein [Montanilutibacter psychrotolerans]|uniref:DUF3380 domain-containing protein n=1 Tax=Montanilutibacter psychrotolerans TaxID=1327343 RepID=A0A3M8T4L0_9GAMM|nr:N-acetylmuramidase domain-containing protein [Lysobacter psychrotolerans]RNF86414.1 DUF3380 domain-containing protein [Lysobacter psychrotolerans]
MNRVISPQAWIDLAKSLEVEVATLQAVAKVESSGSGFLPAPSEKPKVLFEGHAFHRLTGGRFAASHPNLSYPKWDRKQYAGSLAGEWKRLDAACQLDRVAALQSASWGAFQIMGFNYAYCGFADVEAFVAAQHAGADQQVAAFACFVARPPYLEALRTKAWAKFAKAYNGPAYAKNRYDEKMAAAYTQFATGGPARKAGKGRTKASAADSQPPGRSDFVPVDSVRRKSTQKRNVRPDPVDLRDWPYRPNIAIAPDDAMFATYPRPTKQQDTTNACTGFALAVVIEYLLDRGRRPVEPISGYMLYDMARRYDEWEDDDDSDSGSSLRGALKGWSRHGASCAYLWEEMTMPAATNEADSDWWLDAVKRPLGAYYRISPECIRDMHIALREVGAIYASAFTHPGWDRLHSESTAPPPTSIAQIPPIEPAKGNQDQGHAFAIVGYTRDGFVVQNSWGGAWGRGGFAVLSYADWLENAMDCWVVQLGVVTTDHDLVAGATTLRVDGKTGRAVISSNPTLADHEISPFVINMENEGHLSRRGRFRTSPDDLKLLLDHHLPAAHKRWSEQAVQRKQPPPEHIDIAIYAHGGLTDEEAAAKTAQSWIPHLYSNRIFPIFLMWETGAVATIGNLFEDAVKGEAEKTGGEAWGRFRRRFEEWRDERLEGLARLPGGKLWGEMKQNADALSGSKNSGVVQLFEMFRNSATRDGLPPIRLHLIGHSAGAIVHTWLGARAIKYGFDVSSISLLAPAVRLELFDRQLGAAIVDNDIRVLIANLRDEAERSDNTCKPYGHSLLYLVARAFEEHEETPLLGMEKHLVPALPTREWGANVRQLRCPGGMWTRDTGATTASTHGGLDDDPVVREAVVSFLLGKG